MVSDPPLDEDAADGLADESALATLKQRVIEGDEVAVYQNKVLDSSDAGRLIFLIVGPTRTLKEPPKRAPDGPYGPGWQYLLLGLLDLNTNRLKGEKGAADVH